MKCTQKGCNGEWHWVAGPYFDHSHDRIYDLYSCSVCGTHYETPERRELNE